MRLKLERLSNLAVFRWATAELPRLLTFGRHNRRTHLAAERVVCLQAFRAAQRAGDTRLQHVTERAAVHATAAVLAAEIGRGPSAWRGAR